jgi:hypothetical protein
MASHHHLPRGQPPTKALDSLGGNFPGRKQKRSIISDDQNFRCIHLSSTQSPARHVLRPSIIDPRQRSTGLALPATLCFGGGVNTTRNRSSTAFLCSSPFAYVLGRLSIRQLLPYPGFGRPVRVLALQWTADRPDALPFPRPASTNQEANGSETTD